MRYVSLHTHTTFSFGDGFGPVPMHVQRVADLGMKAVAFTEHGNTSSHAQLEKEARKHDIDPIFGCELYATLTDPETGQPARIQRKFHQTVLAADEEGYRNLNRIVSTSWRDHFYYWPTTSRELLRERASGLVVLSGCSDSHLSCTLLGGKSLGDKRLSYDEADIQAACRVVEEAQEIFGDRYYLEVQRFPGLERTCLLNPAFAEIARRTGARLAASSDVHYPFPEQNDMQRILHAAHRGGTVESADASWEYDILLTYPQSDEEIITDLVGTGLTPDQATAAVLETEAIAARCKVELPKNEPIKFPYPGSGRNGEERTRAWETEPSDDDGYVREHDSINDYIWEKLRAGWKFRAISNKLMIKNKKDYTERILYEMGQIERKGFLDYFGMLSDAVSWAKDNKIAVGPARGSAAASLVCYLLRITEIDPMQFPHMLFARFIDPTRLDLPDVDLDFADDRREEVRQYLIHVYGADRVGNIGNFIRYRGKNSIDDIARVYRIPKWAAEGVKELIVERSGGDARQSDSLEDTFEMFPKAADWVAQYPNLRKATQLEGNYRGLSVHAAGIVISNAPIDETCAMYTRTKAGSDTPTSVVAYDKKDTEYVGMLKADFLGLKTMSIIGRAIDMIGMDLEDLYRVPITERKTLDAFSSNDLVGIFQFEGRATTIVNRDVAPEYFGHLADINALSRPGPLFSGMTAQYIAVKHGREEPERLHPVVDNLTGWTYGQIVYQEQVLSIVKDLAGFPIERVGDIRRIISQKLGNMEMANARAEFIEGCHKMHGVKPELAIKIWNFIATSSTYSFNQSHSVSYAMLAFWCMYLKVYHPAEFYAAALSKVGDGKDVLWRRTRLIHDAEDHDVKILPPDLILSEATWTTSEHGLIGGFMQIPGIAKKTSDKIVEWRANKNRVANVLLDQDELVPVLDWPHLQEVHGIGEKTIKKIEDFVSNHDPYQIHRTNEILDSARDAIRGTAVAQPTHHSTTLPQDGWHDVAWIGLARNLNYKDYVEAQRTRTGRDEADIIAEMKDPELRRNCVVQAYDEGDEDVYVRVNRYAFPSMEEDLQNLRKDTDVLVVEGQKREGDFGISIYAKQIWVLRLEEDEETDFDEEEVSEEEYVNG